MYSSTSKTEKEKKTETSHVQVVEFEVSLSEMGVMTPYTELIEYTHSHIHTHKHYTQHELGCPPVDPCTCNPSHRRLPRLALSSDRCSVAGPEDLTHYVELLLKNNQSQPMLSLGFFFSLFLCTLTIYQDLSTAGCHLLKILF